MSFETIFIGTALAQQTGNSTQTGNPLGMFLPMVVVFGIFYLLLIRPQAKQRKQHQNLIKNLKKGDEVITAAGIHGKIAAVADTQVTLEIADNIRVKLEKQQIATVKNPSPAP